MLDSGLCFCIQPLGIIVLVEVHGENLASYRYVLEKGGIL
jgi:hypothetical protein